MASVTPVNTHRNTAFTGRFIVPVTPQDAEIFERHLVPLFKAMKDEPIRAYKASSKLYVYTGTHDVDKLKAILPTSSAKASYTQTAYGIKPTKIVEQGDRTQTTNFIQNAAKYPLKELANLKDLIRNIILQ